jgi:hypothetical protein
LRRRSVKHELRGEIVLRGIAVVDNLNGITRTAGQTAVRRPGVGAAVGDAGCDDCALGQVVGGAAAQHKRDSALCRRVPLQVERLACRRRVTSTRNLEWIGVLCEDGKGRAQKSDEERPRDHHFGGRAKSAAEGVWVSLSLVAKKQRREKHGGVARRPAF